MSVLPRVTGAQALIVLSGSMEPSIPVGSVVIARPVDPAAVEVGDVITFEHGDPAQTDSFDPELTPLVTHRVVEVEETGEGSLLHTRGDANDVPDDPPVPAADVRGEVWYHIPYFGYAQQAMEQGPTLMYVLAGILLVFGLWLLGVALSDDGDDEDGGGDDDEDGGEAVGAGEPEARPAATPPRAGTRPPGG
ncbi:signal peptidase [Spinactinospora alkalitolerans]|uniref:Signal peptidase I n=1 Tax=Spinactinospora alkalitolerans TaxID=687207 RepID=A0A852U6A0_9ACTN|nr:signal peptidase [Spinactinospora alkalitolerans]